MSKDANQRRDKLDIILQMLYESRGPIPARKTHLIYKCRINFYQVSRYIDHLTQIGFLEEVDKPFHGYRTTEKGSQLMSMFNYDGFKKGSEPEE